MPSDSPALLWRRNYLALKAWQAVHGALPKASFGAQAKTLANWLAKAKQLYNEQLGTNLKQLQLMIATSLLH